MRKKEVINVLTIFFIFHKSDVKTFLKQIVNQYPKDTLQYFLLIIILRTFISILLRGPKILLIFISLEIVVQNFSKIYMILCLTRRPNRPKKDSSQFKGLIMSNTKRCTVIIRNRSRYLHSSFRLQLAQIATTQISKESPSSSQLESQCNSTV